MSVAPPGVVSPHKNNWYSKAPHAHRVDRSIFGNRPNFAALIFVVPASLTWILPASGNFYSKKKLESIEIDGWHHVFSRTITLIISREEPSIFPPYVAQVRGSMLNLASEALLTAVSSIPRT